MSIFADKDGEMNMVGKTLCTILWIVYAMLLYNGGTSPLGIFFGAVLYGVLSMMLLEALVYAVLFVYIIFWEMPRAVYNRARQIFN